MALHEATEELQLVMGTALLITLPLPRTIQVLSIYLAFVIHS